MSFYRLIVLNLFKAVFTCDPPKPKGLLTYVSFGSALAPFIIAGKYPVHTKPPSTSLIGIYTIAEDFIFKVLARQESLKHLLLLFSATYPHRQI